jgi:hypothetical protein
MANFADKMNSLTEHLRASTQARNEVTKQIRAASADLLGRAQAFMSQVADENQTRAEELRESLAAHREECRQKADELKTRHQESLEKMRDDLNETLSETRQTREDTVKQLIHTFQHARNELAVDLHEASNVWQAFVAGRVEPLVGKRRAKDVASPRVDEPVESHVPVRVERVPSKPAHGSKHAKAVNRPSKPSRASR